MRVSVDSSCVRSVGYDAEARLLEIEFTGGGVYEYVDVPACVHERLMTADSRGRYVNLAIRGRFAFRRLG